MPVTWTISAPNRLVIAVCKAPVTRKDVEAYLDAVVVAGGLPYRKIFDLGEATLEHTDADMMALGARIQAYAQQYGEPMGPLAIVAGSDKAYEQARVFATLGAAKRPIKIFRELHLARRWLDEQPVPEA
jgi:hypothetical protein